MLSLFTPLNSDTTLPPAVTTPSDPTDFVVPVAICITLVFVLVLLVILLILLWRHRHHLPKLCPVPRPRRHETSQTGVDRGRGGGRYSHPWVLQGLVGQGRFGHVYKALYNGNVVAVKVYSHHK